ncbi:MAG TPA: DUF5666 domain-containing protein, partial [Candidatus Angelobacter sp.]|nr:DUF5666 domain-containing protein [Candidatus Angelobacter sp.]
MKRVPFVTLFSVVFALALTLAGCGGSNSVPPLQTTGTSAQIGFGDAVGDNLVKLELTVTAITLTGTPANTGNLLAAPGEMEFVHTAGTIEPFSVGKIPPGTYTSATLTVSNPEITVVNAGVVSQPAATLSSGTITVTFTSPIVVTTSPLFLNFDLDITKSVDLTKTPVLVTPTLTVTTSTVPADQSGEDNGDGEDDEVHGTVSAIAAPNFTITTKSGASIVFATDANTKFNDGLTQLSDLKVNDIVEVDAVTKTDGSKLATKVERESGQNGEELEGVISALDNPLTKVTIAHQVDSTNSPTAPATVDITVNASTVYSVRTDKLSITAPPFDATHIGAGQRIEGDASSSTAPIVATKVKLREQALLGTVSNASATGFTLTPSPTSAFATLSKATSVAVTFASGAKQIVVPANGATIRVRGLVFVNAGAYSMIAVRT